MSFTIKDEERWKTLLEKELERVNEKTQRVYLSEWNKSFGWAQPGQLFRVTEDVEGLSEYAEVLERMRLDGKRVAMPNLKAGSVIMLVQVYEDAKIKINPGTDREGKRSFSGPLWLFNERLLINKVRVSFLEPINLDSTDGEE